MTNTTIEIVGLVLYVLITTPLLMLWPFVSVYCAMDASDRCRSRWVAVVVVVVLCFYPFAWIGWLIVRGYWSPEDHDTPES
jgi:hypothetical protein